MITGDDITLRSSNPAPDDRHFDAYGVRPDAPMAPAILLLPEMFGLTPAMRESADAFARHGHAVLAPNMFWRAEHPRALAYDGVDRDIANLRLAECDIDLAVKDIADAVSVLRDMGGGPQVVAIGHCIGGRLAVLALSRLRLDGAISYYGLGLNNYPEEMSMISAPVQLHYGLADPHVPPDEIASVAKLVAHNPMVTLHKYAGAGHSFVNPYRPMFDATLARQVMQSSIALIDFVGANKAEFVPTVGS